jgi:hypothetical protein
MVLVIGRFRHGRQTVQEAILEELRRRGYLPLSLDLDGSSDLNLKEILLTLIGLSRFVIADLSGARDHRLELEVMAPGLSSAPVQPLLADSDTDAVLIDNIRSNPQFLNIFTYSDEEELLASLSTKVVDPPEEKIRELPKRRATDKG